MLKVNDKNRYHSGVVIVNFEHISLLVVVFLLFVSFEHVIADWVPLKVKNLSRNGENPNYFL